MKMRCIAILVLTLSISAPKVLAEDGNAVAALQQQLQEMEVRFRKIQSEQQREIEALKLEIVKISAERTMSTTVAATPAGPPPSVQQPGAASPRAGSSYMNIGFGSTMDAGASTEREPSERLQLGDHDPQKRGFSLRNAELSLDGAVDPYFKGFANVVLKLDENDETEIELEESYLQSTALPANLQLKAGQFLANFGRQNSQHPHQWAFVDQPLVLNRAFGGDGLRGIGTQVSWLLPTDFFSELSLGVLDGQGGTAFNFRNPGEADELGVERFHGRTSIVEPLDNVGDLLFAPRLAASFDLTDTQTAVVGLSGAFGPNSSGSGSRTGIFGGDLYWKWKPENSAAGFPFVSWQSEALFSEIETAEDVAAGLPDETLRDHGFYSQVLWGFTQGWVSGVRGEYVDGNSGAFDEFDPYRGERIRFSPVLTYYPSEFSKLRLQYNFDSGEYLRDASSVWMQFEFNIGAHAAHKF
jgi:hypothetical protein